MNSLDANGVGSSLGWIMYLMSVQTLLLGAKLVMYDGSPFVPNVDTFLHVADKQRYSRPTVINVNVLEGC